MARRQALLTTVAVLVATGSASGAGYFNLPTSLQQCLGVGFGPGYHAPLILGPPWKGVGAVQRVKRVWHPLKPPCHSGFAEPAVLGMSPASSYGPAYDSMPMHTGAPMGPTFSTQAFTVMEPTPAEPPTAGYEVVPAPAASR